MVCICKRTCTSDIAITQQVQNFTRDGVRHMTRSLTFQLNQTTQDKCNTGEPPKADEKSERCLGDVKQGRKVANYTDAGIQYVSQSTAKSSKTTEVGRSTKCASILGCRAKEKDPGSNPEDESCGATSPVLSCTVIMRLGVTYRLRGTTEWIPIAWFSQNQAEGDDEWSLSAEDADLSSADKDIVEGTMGDESLWDSGGNDRDGYGGDFHNALRNNRSVREAMCKKLFEMGPQCKSEVSLSLAGPGEPYPDKEVCCDCF